MTSQMERRMFEILQQNQGQLISLHDLVEGLPPQGSGQQQALDALEDLCSAGLVYMHVGRSGFCPIALSYQLQQNYQQTAWYKNYLQNRD